MQFIYELGLFTSKTMVILLLIVGLVAIIAMIVQRAQSFKQKLHVENLNDHFDFYEQTLKHFTLTKKQWKAEEKKLKEEMKEKDEEATKPRLFVIDFKGDVHAEEGENLREEITAILTMASPQDEVVLRLESPGGVVHGYGFCASQLERLKMANIPLTICVDQIAASGGYMMSVLAQKLIAAPFAIIGSVGVVAQVPNFNKLLRKNDIEYKEYTAGDFKRTVSIFGEITEKGESKFKEQLEATHVLFKDHIRKHRPSVAVESIATGEYWYGSQALDLKLIDSIGTSDDYLLGKRKSHEIIKVEHKEKKPFAEKLAERFAKSTLKVLLDYNQKSKFQ